MACCDYIILVVSVTLSSYILSASSWNYKVSSTPEQGQCGFATFESSTILGSVVLRNALEALSPKNRTSDSDDLIKVGKRIVNGLPADTNTDWPWLAGIFTAGGPISSHGRSWSLTCGGTLIHPEFVMTAAHCVVEVEGRWSSHRLSPSDMLVRLGDNNLYTDDTTTAEDFQVAEIFTHPQYDPFDEDQGADVTLLRLARPYQRKSDKDPLRVACLPSANDIVRPSAGALCYVAGWGSMHTDGKSTEHPMYTVLQTTSFSQCSNRYGFDSDKASDGRMFCASASEHRPATDTCTGDSGGGVFCKHSSASGSSWQLQGVVSFGGSECAPADLLPGVYMNVGYYRQWISDTIKYKGNSPALPGHVTPATPFTTTKPPRDGPFDSWPTWWDDYSEEDNYYDDDNDHGFYDSNRPWWNHRPEGHRPWLNGHNGHHRPWLNGQHRRPWLNDHHDRWWNDVRDEYPDDDRYYDEYYENFDDYDDNADNWW